MRIPADRGVLALTGTLLVGWPEGLAADVGDPAAVLVDDGPQVYTWAGPYAGGFVGYSRADFDNPAGGTFRADGFIGGVYAGYNLQSERLVYGLAALGLVLPIPFVGPFVGAVVGGGLGYLRTLAKKN